MLLLEPRGEEGFDVSLYHSILTLQAAKDITLTMTSSVP
jgi:hypothetical protein